MGKNSKKMRKEAASRTIHGQNPRKKASKKNTSYKKQVVTEEEK